MSNDITPRKGGLGSLLEDADDDLTQGTDDTTDGPTPSDPPGRPAARPGDAGHSDQPLADWRVQEHGSNAYLGTVQGRTYQEAARQAQHQLGRQGGFDLYPVVSGDEPAVHPGAARASRDLIGSALDGRGYPAVLPRSRGRRIAREKLTVSIPASVMDGLAALTRRDSTRRYEEVETALREYLTRKGIPLEEE